LIVFYLLILTFVALVFIGGYDATMRLIAYIDLNIRYYLIRVRSYFMMRKLRSQLIRDKKQLFTEKEKDGL